MSCRPNIKTEKFQGRLPSLGTREALCTLIRQSVRRLVIDDEKEMTMEFSSGSILIVPLDFKNRIGPEAIHFLSGKSGDIDIW